VKTQIQNRIIHERRTSGFNDLVEKLKQKSGYKLHDQPLQAIVIDTSAPTQEPSGPQPGLIPSPGARP
jgi:hypothetical protein